MCVLVWFWFFERVFLCVVSEPVLSVDQPSLELPETCLLLPVCTTTGQAQEKKNIFTKHVFVKITIIITLTLPSEILFYYQITQICASRNYSSLQN